MVGGICKLQKKTKRSKKVESTLYMLEAVTKLKSSFCLEKYETSGKTCFRLKRKHDYFYQVQAQMYCANKPWCDFVFCTERSIHVERINRQPQWWNQQLQKLKVFNSLLPELACPRFNSGEIRESVDFELPRQDCVGETVHHLGYHSKFIF